MYSSIQAATSHLHTRLTGGGWPDWLQSVGCDLVDKIYIYLKKQPLLSCDRTTLEEIKLQGWQGYSVRIEETGEINPAMAFILSPDCDLLKEIK